MKKLTLITAIALAATALYTPRVSADATDLILGFRVTDGQGTNPGTDLEIDLGSQANFTSSSSITNLNSLIGADLVATYGANWAARTDLVWGVAGVVGETGAGIHAVYTFDATSSGGAQPEGNVTVAYGNVQGLVSGLPNGTQVGSDTSAFALGTTANPASTVANSYVNQLTDQGKLDGDYGYFSPNANPNLGTSGITEVNYGISTSPIGSNELYQYATSKVPGATGADLGAFSLGTDGTFSFTGADAVPEPSTYAMMAGAMGLLFLAMRRRQSLVG